ncbi:MAG: imidazole glycerol phosphate synthase subunit HisH [Candidatus Omnitrophica bacterium]|nr:imidazole glycerol phosphate synthase subunit HisH [Candidatus Omnitrophota bacterium]
MGIIVIDYGLGNLRSVYNALNFLKGKPKISESPKDVEKADKLVLPGVGAFGDAMTGLKKRGLIEPLRQFLDSGGVYLGICLGLQILFEESEEGNAKGLGIFKGKIKRFTEGSGIKVPHMGWNSIDQRPNAKNQRLLEDIKDGSYFYFDHSYYADPDDKDIVAATTSYGTNFTSMVCKDNIYAVQFHPERSQDLGLKLLENFVKL